MPVNTRAPTLTALLIQKGKGHILYALFHNLLTALNLPRLTRGPATRLIISNNTGSFHCRVKALVLSSFTLQGYTQKHTPTLNSANLTREALLRLLCF